jgi:signal transduction histidine kinase/CheY-like chemotaxis protein
MDSLPILEIPLRTEQDVVHARQRGREVAAALGFDNQDQIRLATATSEIARNAFRYAKGGVVTFAVSLDLPQRLEITVKDSGPGIANLDEIMAGRYRSDTGMGMGIVGTKRLMDEFHLKTGSGGITARMMKQLPRNVQLFSRRRLEEMAGRFRNAVPESPYAEIERQNQELLKTLQELRARQDELMLLNRELEDTNRGVVALYAELDERADYLRRASELKTKFLSNVSHEFRTPLNSIISLARLLSARMDGDLTPEQAKQVQYIESSARDLQDLVNDLLDLAKVEAGKIKIRPKSFEVRELFSALKGMLKPLLADNSAVDLLFVDPADLPVLRTDEGKVSQILRNLISNALKFTPNGKVIVSARHENRHVLFEVADTGIGIPAEYHEAIFQEFSQLENPLQERHRGTGLGLPLCRNLTALLGGRMWLQSEAGRGSTFFVEIPIVYVGEAPLASESGSLPVPDFHRLPVLYLEDSTEAAHTFETFLRNTEFQPILASNLQDAGAWVSRHTPAAVISDVYLGEHEAWELLRALRAKFPSLPILVTSAFDEAQRASNEGATLFLPKPLDRERLLQELRTLISAPGTRQLLIVDDNEVSRYILRQLLDLPWLQIIEAKNGGEALAALAESAPDAVVLDLLMPDITGLEVLRHIRELDSTANLPVLIYTSKTLSEEEITNLASLGAGVVRKEDISTRLSAQPFLDWLTAEGVVPQKTASPANG